MSPLTLNTTVPRTSVIGGKLFEPVMTHHHDERSGAGVWSRPDTPVLVFSDSLWAKPFTYHNGRLGGGKPVQLIFWGDWWLHQRGIERRQLIESRTQALLQSAFFNELLQYHVDQPPVWRGSMTVTNPDPPESTDPDTAMEALRKMIDKQVSDDRLPDPDDERIIAIVLMPEAFTATGGVLGAHGPAYYWDFWPLDEDNYWAGWVEQPDTNHIDDVMVTLSHELVEILTDAELDGWHTDPYDRSRGEIADIGASSLVNADGLSETVQQSAWVNDVKVTSYWSNRHNACVVPIDRDYGALLTYQISETRRSLADEGTFRPSAADRAACPEVPACCIEDRDYRWAEYDVTETAHIELQHTRYRTPSASWSINGQVVSFGEDTLDLTVDIDEFNGLNTVATTKRIHVDYVAHSRYLDLTVKGARGNFDLHVGCSVRDLSINGNLTTNVIAAPEVMVGFVCAVIELEQSYLDQIEHCLTAMLHRYTERRVPTGRTLHRDPINYDPNIEDAILPAYARIAQYRQARRLRSLIPAANYLLGPEAARLFIERAIDRVPAMSGAMQRLASHPGVYTSAAASATPVPLL
jgi:hypothetical protein